MTKLSTYSQKTQSKKYEFSEKECQKIADIQEELDGMGKECDVFFHFMGYFSNDEPCTHTLSFIKEALRRKGKCGSSTVDDASRRFQKNGWIIKNPDKGTWKRNGKKRRGREWLWKLAPIFYFLTKVDFKNLPFRVHEILKEREAKRKEKVIDEFKFEEAMIDIGKFENSFFVSQNHDAKHDQYNILNLPLASYRKGMDSGYKPTLNYEFEMSKTCPGFKVIKNRPFNNIAIEHQLMKDFPEIPRDEYHYFQKVLPFELAHAKTRREFVEKKERIRNMASFVLGHIKKERAKKERAKNAKKTQ